MEVFTSSSLSIWCLGVRGHALAHAETKVIAPQKRIKPDSVAPPGQVSRWAWKAAERRIKRRQGAGRARGWRKLFSTSCWKQQSELPRHMQAPHGINEARILNASHRGRDCKTSSHHSLAGSGPRSRDLQGKTADATARTEEEALCAQLGQRLKNEPAMD